MSGQSTSTPTHEQDQVEYRDAPGFPGYRVGSDGSVWSNRRSRLTREWRRLVCAPRQKGRRVATLRVGGKTLGVYVHRLVLLAFAGPCPAGMQARHLDGDRENNRWSNLAWGTPQDNNADVVRHGSRRGTKNGAAVLDDATVRMIRRRIKAGESKASIARDVGINHSTVSGIDSRRRWSHVTDEGD